jgi:hypothetical protein
LSSFSHYICHFQHIVNTARLVSAPRPSTESKLPELEKRAKALQFLQENPDENPITAARIWKIKKPNTLQRAWKREKERTARAKQLQYGGHNKILTEFQHKALI